MSVRNLEPGGDPVSFATVWPDPCKNRKTGRIIDSVLKFARVNLDKVI
jgi:hypothetical protein